MIFSNLFSLSNALDSVAQRYVELAFRSPRVCVQHLHVATGPLQPIFESSGSTSATTLTAVGSKPRRRANVLSRRSFTNRAIRPSSHPSNRKEPDLTGFASVSANIPNVPTLAFVPNDSSGLSASTSAIPSTVVPDPLAADPVLIFTPLGTTSLSQPIFDLSASTLNPLLTTHWLPNLAFPYFHPSCQMLLNIPSKKHPNRRRRVKA